MRILVIHRDMRIEEIDADESEWMGDLEWDAVRIDEAHDAYVHDHGLSEPGVVFADIGDNRHVPLPAYVTGFDGERMASATITADGLRRLIT